MFITTVWLIISLAGFFVLFVGSIFGGTFGTIMIMGGGTMMFVPVIQTTTVIRVKRLVPFFMKLKPWEAISLFVNERFQIFPLIFNTKHEGILQKDRIGMVEDKGTPLTWGNLPISITLQNAGVSIDLKKSQYVARLYNGRGIETYEQAVKKYLGPAKYTEFAKRYRTKPKPDIFAIRSELHRLLDETTPNDPLSEKICGETIDFKNYLNFLVYAYHPRSSINAMNAEKIQTKREAMAYKEAKQGRNIGITIFLIVLALIIFMVVWNSIGGMF